MYCFDFSKELYIEGDFTADAFSQIMIQVRPCRETLKSDSTKNSTSKTVC